MNITATYDSDSDTYDRGEALHITLDSARYGLVVGRVNGTYFLTYKRPIQALRPATQTDGATTMVADDGPAAGISHDASTGMWELRCWGTGKRLSSHSTMPEALAEAIGLLLGTEVTVTPALAEAAMMITLADHPCTCLWSGTPDEDHADDCPTEVHLRALQAIRDSEASGPDRIG